MSGVIIIAVMLAVWVLYPYIVTEGEATRAPEPDVSQQAASVTVPEAAIFTRALDFIFGVR